MFYLFGTSHCHLCADAEALLSAISVNKTITWKSVDIAHNEALLSLYAMKIPVLKSSSTNSELCWPFDIETAEAFITRNQTEK